MSGALCRTAEICNSRGLHARAAAKFCKVAQQFESEISVHRNGNDVAATSIMGLMMLSASQGSTIEMRAKGPDAAAALDALCELVANKFDEE
ncbi:MAG: HPr family phosphocarrier protein [Rhodobacteraceae bacterium]|nr:HPr family phosphocarrier protein [Paracoccaceae bacterium]